MNRFASLLPRTILTDQRRGIATAPDVKIGLPLRPGLTAADPRLDVLQPAIDRSRVDLQRDQAAAGRRQQFLQYQLSQRPFLAIQPRHIGLQADACGVVEIAPRCEKRQARFDVRVFSAQVLDHQTVVEGHLRRHVDHGRSGRHHPVLDPQMRGPVVVITHDRTVPTPDRPVVQPQAREPVDFLISLQREQHRKQLFVFLEQERQVGGRISRPKANPVDRPIHRDRLFEERDSRLLPQQLAEQQRRVRGDRDHRRRQDQRPVVSVRRSLLRHLEVQLQ